MELFSIMAENAVEFRAVRQTPLKLLGATKEVNKHESTKGMHKYTQPSSELYHPPPHKYTHIHLRTHNVSFVYDEVVTQMDL